MQRAVRNLVSGAQLLVRREILIGLQAARGRKLSGQGCRENR